MEQLFDMFDRTPNFPINNEVVNSIQHKGTLSAGDNYVDKELKKSH